MATPKSQPSSFDWHRLLPDMRGWAVLGFFTLAWRLFEMIDANPKLTENQGFMLLTQAVIVSGLIGSVAAFLFSSSKGSADARNQEGARAERLTDAIAAMATGAGVSGDVTTDDVTVTADEVNVEQPEKKTK